MQTLDEGVSISTIRMQRINLRSLVRSANSPVSDPFPGCGSRIIAIEGTVLTEQDSEGPASAWTEKSSGLGFSTFPQWRRVSWSDSLALLHQGASCLLLLYDTASAGTNHIRC